MSEFYQIGPELKNQYESDPILKDYVKRAIPSELLQEIENDLSELGEKARGRYMDLARQALASEPRLVHYSPWGERVDEIETSHAWKELDRAAAQEGLISIAYKREQQEYSRIYQFAKLYLFHPASAIYTCPLAMTDGAAKLLETMGTDALKKRAFHRLTSDRPESFWTSGQWMTEKTGGSDVRRTQTIAKKKGDEWELHGVKWFSSATTSQAAMTLAREESPDGPISLFYVETHGEDGKLNNIEVLRLKDKLGTNALPTAELKLNGTPAIRFGEPGKGIKNIATLFNITRIYNALCAVANMRRILALSMDYAKKREAFGKKIIDHGLHRQTLFQLQAEYIGCFHLVFKTVEILGRLDAGKASEEEEKLLRLLTPLAKLFTGKRGVEVVSEALESFGGAGYIEDTGIPQILRDAQVLSIWEGTTNILSLDVLRSIGREDSLTPLLAEIKRMDKEAQGELAGDRELRAASDELFKTVAKSAQDLSSLERKARDFSFALGNVYIAWLLRIEAQRDREASLKRVYEKSFFTWTRRFKRSLLQDEEAYDISSADLIC